MESRLTYAEVWKNDNPLRGRKRQSHSLFGAKMPDDLCRITANDLFGAVSSCDPPDGSADWRTAGKKKEIWSERGDKISDSDGFPDLNLP